MKAVNYHEIILQLGYVQLSIYNVIESAHIFCCQCDYNCTMIMIIVLQVAYSMWTFMKNEHINLNTFSVACLLSALCRTGLLDEVSQMNKTASCGTMILMISSKKLMRFITN